MPENKKHLCDCNGKGWFRNKDQEWDLCLAGCMPPQKPQTPDPKARIVLPMLKAYNAARKVVA